MPSESLCAFSVLAAASMLGWVMMMKRAPPSSGGTHRWGTDPLQLQLVDGKTQAGQRQTLDVPVDAVKDLRRRRGQQVVDAEAVAAGMAHRDDVAVVPAHDTACRVVAIGRKAQRFDVGVALEERGAAQALPGFTRAAVVERLIELKARQFAVVGLRRFGRLHRVEPRHHLALCALGRDGGAGAVGQLQRQRQREAGARHLGRAAAVRHRR